MTKQQWIISIYLTGVVGIVSWWIFTDRVQLSLGISETQSNYSPTPAEISEQLWTIENITWSLRIWPGTLPRFLNTLWWVEGALHVETYDLTEKKVKSLFTQLLQKNVKINLIMENQKYQQFKSTRKEIQKYFSGYSGFAIKNDKQMHTEYQHSKFAVRNQGALIQTSNLNASSFTNNREYIFYTEHPGIIASLSGIFYKDRTGLPILKSDIHPNLAVCPINCRGIIEWLISGARSSIMIQNQYIDDNRIRDFLLARQKMLWISNIKIQLPGTESNQELLRVFGSSLHLFKKPYLHAKMLLIDEKILLLSSINLSANSMDNNREIGILLTDPIVIREFIEQFRKDGRLK